ncbi:MAG TPA: hypothetical protein VE398_21945, partial [Acidobacteriota bacterium]|nr:hypothetical protein [Acidobacteriota bacterium]
MPDALNQTPDSVRSPHPHTFNSDLRTQLLLKPEPARRLLSEPSFESFHNGTECRLYDILGAHLMSVNGNEGVWFSLWAPNAEHVTVIGDFNQWDKSASPLSPASRS